MICGKFLSDMSQTIQKKHQILDTSIEGGTMQMKKVWKTECTHLMQAFLSSCSDSHMKKIAATAASEFWKWVMIEIGVCIHNQKYHVKPHSSLWLSDALAAATAQRNYFCL